MNRRSRRNRRSRGFTLMEILLVLAILVVLGSMVSLGYVKIQQESNKKIARTEINVLESAVSLYMQDVGTLPSSLDALLQPPSDLARPEKWAGPYLEKEQLPLDPWNQDYQYEVVDHANAKFRIWSSGPDQQAGSSDDISTTL